MKPELLVRLGDQLRFEGCECGDARIERRALVRRPLARSGSPGKVYVDLEMARLGRVQGSE